MGIIPAAIRAEGTLRDAQTVTLVGNASEMDEFARLLADWNPELVIRRTARLSPGEILDGMGLGGVAIWVVLVPDRGARVYFVDSTERRYLLREVPLAAGLDEAGRETLAQVVATSARSFVAQQVSSSAVEIESSLREDSPSPSPTQRPTSDGGAFDLRGSVAPTLDAGATLPDSSWLPYLGCSYATQFVSAEVIGHGPGLEFGGARRFGVWRWVAMVEGQYQFPLVVEDRQTALTLRDWKFGAAVAAERPLTAPLALGLELGTTVTRRSYALTVDSPDISADPAAVHVLPELRAGLRAGLDVDSVHVTLRLGLNAALVKTHHDISHRPIFTPWMLAPRFAIDLGWR